jgi:hypothetical protein
MTEVTLNKNKYGSILNLKKRADESLRRFFMRKGNFNTASARGLLELSDLNILGGVKNLSSKFDEYLYS